MKPEVHLIVKKCGGPGRDIGFKLEYQAFVNGKAIDEVELTKESKKKLAKRFAADYKKVYINGKCLPAD